MADCELLVIGGGAAGLAAARAAAARGVAPLLVTSGALGGECTHSGCVPSKALIAAARRGDDFPVARAHMRACIEAIALTEDEASLAAEGIAVMFARARPLQRGIVDVDGAPVRARRIVLATGSRPSLPSIPGLHEHEVLTNENVFTLDALPASLAILGGGAVGCELAQVFARMGVRITLVEIAHRLLSREEPEASADVVVGMALIRMPIPYPPLGDTHFRKTACFVGKHAVAVPRTGTACR